MRPFTSAYDSSFASATDRLLEALRNAGHTVETPVTGSVLMDGVEIPPAAWDRLAIEYDGDLDEILPLIRGE